MKLRGAHTNFLAFVVVLFLALGTLLAGNHCFLGGMKVTTAAEHSCCAKAAKAAAPSPASGYSECCASLAAPLPSHASAPAGRLQELFAAWLPVPDVLAATSDITLSSVLGGPHAPPGPPPLYEFVLSRSLPAHAPPSALV